MTDTYARYQQQCGMGGEGDRMKRSYIVVSLAGLWIVLGCAWALAYFVAWYVGMGVLSFLLIAAWAAYMRRVIERNHH